MRTSKRGRQVKVAPAEAATLGAVFRSIRLERNLSQNELARAAGVSQQTITDIELGRSRGATFETVRRLCRGLQMTLTELDGRLPPPPDPPAA